MFDLVRLRLLRELSHRGTMTAVADACGLTSSAVSQQLTTLEREAGVALLERIGRRVQLTSEGERLVAHVDGILQAVDAAGLDLRAGRDEVRGTLAIASFSTYAKAHLLPAVIRAHAIHPQLEVVIHELEPPDAIQALREGRCQIAVSFAYSLVPRPRIAGLVSELLIDEAVVLVLPASWQGDRSAIDVAQLAQAEWIVGSRQSDDRQLAERVCAPAGFAPRITHTVDDYDLLLKMVAAGMGIGLVPELGFRVADDPAVVAGTLAGPPLRRRIDALTRATLAPSPMVRALLSLLATPA
jgi:DNA-binding transcriptional LysR family regulator